MNTQKRRIKGNDVPGVSFMHIRMNCSATNNKGPACTFAFRFGDGVLDAGLAMCSPQDNFSRPRGWTIARGRLLSANGRCLFRWKLPFTESGDRIKDMETAHRLLRHTLRLWIDNTIPISPFAQWKEWETDECGCGDQGNPGPYPHSLEQEVHTLRQTIDANEKIKAALRRELDEARADAREAGEARNASQSDNLRLTNEINKLCSCIGFFERALRDRRTLRHRLWPWISTRLLWALWRMVTDGMPQRGLSEGKGR